MGKGLTRRRAMSLASAAALASIATASPAGAQAQAVSLGSRVTWAKTEAILGGAPSALQAILARQQAITAPTATQLRPASRSAAALTPAIVRELPPVSRAALSGTPDVFGSVALRVGRTSLNSRWRRVEQARLVGAPARYAAGLSDLTPIERLEAVNRYVNDRVRFTEDQRQYGRPDVWSAAADTLKRGRGDCEDYAIAKLQMLRRAGFADRDLYLVIVKDLVSRSDHAVLVVRSGGRMYVLDNGTNALLDSDAVRDYRPVLTFAASGTWTHGYRVRPVEQIAATDVTDVEVPVPGTGNQRSRSASLLALSTGFNK